MAKKMLKKAASGKMMRTSTPIKKNSVGSPMGSGSIRKKTTTSAVSGNGRNRIIKKTIY